MRWHKPSGPNFLQGHSLHHQAHSTNLCVFNLLFASERALEAVLWVVAGFPPQVIGLQAFPRLSGRLYFSRLPELQPSRLRHKATPILFAAPSPVYFSRFLGVTTVYFWLNSCPSPESYFMRMPIVSDDARQRDREQFITDRGVLRDRDRNVVHVRL